MRASSMFTAERAVFEKNRKKWVRTHPGEFVVIQDNEVAGFFKDYSEALKAGLKQFGVKRQFFIQQVWINEPVYLVS